MREKSMLSCVGLGLLLASGCGDDSGASSRGGDEGIGSGMLETGDGNPDTADGGADTTADGGQTTSSTGNGEDPSDGADGADGADDGTVKWDTTAVPDGGELCGVGGGGNEPEFSFLWAANSGQGTISKIDTKTVTEVGRFMTRPDPSGSPSRTSVSLSGHVAVANRNGGVTKIYASEEFCQESNGIPGIQTSTNNVALPWGQDECVAWHKPMAYASQRPVAWGQGVFNQGTCQWEQEELWTVGTTNGSVMDFYVLDGDDGATKEMISVPTGGASLEASIYGIYGGAVDGNGDFWGSQLGSSGKLIRVNRADMSYDIWDTPNGPHWYGMTVDNEGIVWLCSSSVGRFDPATETWATNSVGGYTGCMADADGLLWMSTGVGVVGVNRDTLQVEKTFATGGSYGVSIDFEGYVWTVAFGNNAHKVDPDSGEVWTYGGLVGAYTYSDMTGYALSNAGTPSG